MVGVFGIGDSGDEGGLNIKSDACQIIEIFVEILRLWTTSKFESVGQHPQQ